MRYSFPITILGLLSSAFAITITTPSSNTVWDFSTPKTIKFTRDSGDPSVISIILRTQDGSFQTKLADNVKTSAGQYTTQPNPSIIDGYGYEIQIIDSAGQLAVSDTFTAKKGASDDGTIFSSSSTITATTTSSTSSTSSSSSSSEASSETTSTSVSSTLTPSASLTPTSSTSSTTSLSSSSSKTASSTSSETSSTIATTSALHSTGAASSQFSAPKEAMTLLGAAFALFYV
ncbi:hypothetical protein PENCOP_c017G01807 [Penicillium coprophilum]|uniref:Yeast cell wall synthesis Kre9/Knh1-like N-terminal domain-containing protein n=1 Tax=Penicillium coprophilum TaxID=36646 RepID=A0A1V6U7Y5_9EURO|nr:hypothetical protein PENCOP_c017G01807 [Penicillium coprophilum]